MGEGEELETAPEILLEVLQKPGIDKVKRLVVVWDDGEDFVVKSVGLGRFKDVGLLLYGIMTVCVGRKVDRE